MGFKGEPWGTSCMAQASPVVGPTLRSPQLAPESCWLPQLVGLGGHRGSDCRILVPLTCSETLFFEMADRLAEDGWRELGYEYINIDDCWSAKKRDAAGRLVADPERFPRGIKALADYVSSRWDGGVLCVPMPPWQEGWEETEEPSSPSLQLSSPRRSMPEA